MNGLEGRVVVVTGGGSGIGQGCVMRCLADGASVVIGDLSDEALEATAELARAAGAGDRLATLKMDITEESEMAALVDLALDRFGGLDALLNNAGAGMAVEGVGELEVADWDRAMAVLLRGPFLGTKHAVRVFRKLGKGGAIVNIASVAGLSAGAGPLGYTTAKAGIVNFTRGAAVELAPERIRVNCISPGMILTPLTTYRDPDESKAFYDTLQPWPDHGEPADIAAAFRFLIGDDARFVTGHNLVVDGGVSIYSRLADDVYKWVEANSEEGQG